MSQSGYGVFLEAAKEAEAFLRSRPGATDADLAEAYLYLAGAWEYHIERVFKGGDVDRPCFVRDMDNFRSWGLPSPDQNYFSAQIDGNGEYRITGQRGNTVDYCFEVLTGMIGDDCVMGDRIDALELHRIDFGPDGHYEIFLGGKPRLRNWLKAGPTAREVFVRQTSADWRTEQPTPMLIERIDIPNGEPPSRRPSLEEVNALYRKAAQRLLDHLRFLENFFPKWPVPVNDATPPTLGPPNSGYFPGQYNAAGRFEIGIDEALVIVMEQSTARYQSISLGHPLWFNSISPRTRQSTMNAAQSRLSSDGVYRYALGVQDPGVSNWIDTGGHTKGFYFVRFQGVSGDAPPKLQFKRVPLAKVRDEFPADEPIIDESARAEARRIRRLSIDRRFF